jgi:hypothetical protein
MQKRGVLLCAVLVSCALSPASRAGQLQVTSTEPAINASNVPVGRPIVIHFNQPVQPASVTPANFWAFGRWSGTVEGTYALSNGNQTVTLTPDMPFSAGESVMVLLSHNLMAADSSPLRAAGYSYTFMTRARPAAVDWTEMQVLSNITAGQTRIYGAAATDLDNDGWLDLTTVNEVSEDLRVFMNLGDGQGTYSDVLEPPLPIGQEASPNDTGDFNHDGFADITAGAAVTNDVWIALGNGDGSYASPAQGITVGNEPHGVAVLDVDGDGDVDLLSANRASNNLSLMLNNGSGVFGAPSFFEGGVNGEYALAVGDMNGDGILDLVVAGRDSATVRTLLSNGNGTFVQAAAQNSGGGTWIVVLGDANGDGDLDAATANSGNANGGVLLGNGNGTFAAPAILNVPGSVVSTDFGDLDGDGDLDVVLSSFGGGIWQVFENNGSGSFSFNEQFNATANPSCSVLLDIDNDRDLDMALTDEIDDTVTIQKNSGTALFGDFANDGDVDLADHSAFAACFSGSGTDAGLPCTAGDFDGDGDVDCADWEDFTAAWTAGGSPPQLPQCAAGPIPALGTSATVVMALALLGAAVVVLRRRGQAPA